MRLSSATAASAAAQQALRSTPEAMPRQTAVQAARHRQLTCSMTFMANRPVMAVTSATEALKEVSTRSSCSVTNKAERQLEHAPLVRFLSPAVVVTRAHGKGSAMLLQPALVHPPMFCSHPDERVAVRIQLDVDVILLVGP